MYLLIPLAESLYSSYSLIRKCVELFTAVGGSFFWLEGLAIADERQDSCSTTVCIKVMERESSHH
jgi:hypothetical protein